MDEPAVPSIDLGALHAPLRTELLAATDRLIERGWFVLGEEVDAFEREWADACDAEFAVGVGTGLDALVLSLEALGIGSGDEVIVPSNTYIATWLAVSMVGAVPVPVEPDPRTHLLTPEAAAIRIGSETAAILPVHLYGRVVDVDGFERLAAQRGLALVLDAAQAHGASSGGVGLGGRGDATAWSFYPTKNLGALGDGGAVTTDDRTIADVVRSLGNYGRDRDGRFGRRGRNSRLDELQAAFLRVKLPHLGPWIERRREIARRYDTGLRSTGLVVPDVGLGDESAWHQYVVRTGERDRLRTELDERGIGTDVHYPVPPHRQDAYVDLGIGAEALPIAEQSADEVLSLPIRPDLTDAEVDRVIAAVVEVAGSFDLRPRSNPD